MSGRERLTLFGKVNEARTVLMLWQIQMRFAHPAEESYPLREDVISFKVICLR